MVLIRRLSLYCLIWFLVEKEVSGVWVTSCKYPALKNSADQQWLFVQVWLAALRETDKQDSAEQHLICEDHFLPEDISTNGVNSDAIPIMPPCLDGPMGMIGPWGAESSEEEDQWATGGCEDDEDEGGDDGPAHVEPPAPEPPAVDPPQEVRRLLFCL